MDLELNRRQFDPDGLIRFVFQENLDGENARRNRISLAEFLFSPLGVHIGICRNSQAFMPVMRERLQGCRSVASMLRGLGVSGSADHGCCGEERK